MNKSLISINRNAVPISSEAMEMLMYILHEEQESVMTDDKVLRNNATLRRVKAMVAHNFKVV